MIPESPLDLNDASLRDAAYFSVTDTLVDAEKAMCLSLETTRFASKIAKVERFLDRVLSTAEVPFTFVRGRDGSLNTLRSSLATRYFSQLPGFVRQVCALSSRYIYNERLSAFIAILKDHGLTGQFVDWGPVQRAHETLLPDLKYRSAAEVFNAIVTDLRRRCRSKSVGEKMRSRRRAADKLHGSCVAYTDKVFDVYKRLLVLRLEFYYTPELAHCIDITLAQEDIAHFLANQRCNAIFADLVGYIVKTEYGVSKGIHHHVVLYFDANSRNPYYQEYYGRQFCDYWEGTITQGRGEAWNLNTKKNLLSLEQRGIKGIGDIRDSDALLRQNLNERVLGYLCKGDQFFRPAYGRDFRRLRKGVAPKKRRPARPKASGKQKVMVPTETVAVSPLV